MFLNDLGASSTRGEGWEKRVEGMASPHPHTRRYPLTSTSSPNPAHKTRVSCDDKAHLARTSEVHRQARQRVYYPGEMGGIGVMQLTAISCLTNISPIKACISFERFDASHIDGGTCEVEFRLSDVPVKRCIPFPTWCTCHESGHLQFPVTRCMVPERRLWI
ncbi:hypothetical protein EV401DRAFT_1333958 [Pisolithus croceorrhizus]|nr:hypothetical protein EV401DRAFT_1333958 [Pisolithus croceorrhizus]